MLPQLSVVMWYGQNSPRVEGEGSTSVSEPRHPYTGYTAQRPVRSTGGPCSEIKRPVVILKSRTTIVFFTISVQLERYIITTYFNYVTVAYLYVKDDRFRGFFQATNVHSPT